ncbi:hypothetical protein HU200_057245 [Digitaria exilis]|uniref:Exocyst subunit Exo70 family protein n=1 Tax=Digitaria exilis TaxID=1010633 RepID=A0A835AHY9_9POAL|nr:hypothetical protein HU200_057245 [Digitaria exilis]
MATGRRGAWTSRVSSSMEQQDPVEVDLAYLHTTNQSHNYNCGMSIGTSRSGTASLSTTAYTTSSSSTGRVSAHSLLSPLAAAPPVVEIDLVGHEKAKTREHIRDLLIHESSHGAHASSATATAMDKWLSELRVSWVLHLAELEVASARRTFVSRRLQHAAHSWALALRLISRSIVCFTGWCSRQEEEEDEPDVWWPPASEFVRFFAAIFLQILPFVDVVVALDTTNPTSSAAISGSGSAVAAVDKLQTLLDVREALSGATEQVVLWHLWLRSSPDAAEATRISGNMFSLLLAKLEKLAEAILDTRDYIRAQSMSLTQEEDDESLKMSSGLDQSPGIHKSLRFLFLINNLYFVWHQLRTNRLLDDTMQVLARRIDGYIKSYLQVSWAPVLKPLHNNALCCFTGDSAKHKFESKFDKTYAAQKLWKVPDPELREELRTAVANTVISAFTSFLEDTGTSASSKLTPESLQEMLEELFEG